MKQPLTLILGSVVMAFIALFFHSCNIEQPTVGKEDEAPKFQHANFTGDNPCTECHESDRPTPDHGGGGNCGSCHKSSDTHAGWSPNAGASSGGGTDSDTKTKTTTDTGTNTGTGHKHPAGLTSCTSCHEKDRPSPTHGGGGDCVSCHEPSDTGGGFKPK